MIIIKFEKKTALEKLLLLTFEEIPPKSCRAALAPDLDNYCNKHHLSANSATCFEYMTKMTFMCISLTAWMHHRAYTIHWGQPFWAWAILSKLFVLPIAEENFARIAADRPFAFGAPFNCRFIEGCSGWEGETETVSQITWNLQIFSKILNSNCNYDQHKRKLKITLVRNKL